MAIAPDAITLPRLVSVKQLYQRALIESTSHDHLVSRIMCVINFDLAVETILKVIIDALDPHNNPKKEWTFHEYSGKADSLMVANNLGILPSKRNINRVHGIRNDGQHNGKYPTPSEVSDCRTYVRDFLERVVPQVWSLQFNTLSLTDLVKHNVVRNFLVKAENAFQKDDFETACHEAVSAIEWTMRMVASPVVGESEREQSCAEFVVQEGYFKKPVTGVGQTAYRAFWKMQKALLITTLGLNYASYIRYREILLDLGINIDFNQKGEAVFFGRARKADLSDDIARYLVAYATETVLQIETLVGDINRPFGIKIRFMDGHTE